MQNTGTLKTLIERNAAIQKAVESFTARPIPNPPTDVYKKQLAKVAEVTAEFQENQRKIEELESSGEIIPKRGPGRPKAIKAEYILSPCDNDNKENYIKSLELSIARDLDSIADAKEKLEFFIETVQLKIKQKERLIRQTKAKLGIGFESDELWTRSVHSSLE